MAANRYAKFTPAQYTPFSLQELMLAPSYMRERHDQSMEALGAADTQIAQTDYLDIHGDVAGKEQQRLFDMVNQQADLLAKEGFSSATKNKLLNLNKEYQRSIAPTGRLGQAQAAKAAYEQAKVESINRMVEQGYDPTRAQFLWDQQDAAYRQKFNETGEITNIDPAYAPNVIDYRKEFTEYAKAAGIDLKEVANQGYLIRDDRTGEFVVNWSKTDVDSTNANGLQELAEMMNRRIMSSDGDIGRYLDAAGIDRQSALDDITNLQGAFTDKSEVRRYGEQRGSQLNTTQEQLGPMMLDSIAVDAPNLNSIAPDSPIAELATMDDPPEFGTNGELVIKEESGFKKFMRNLFSPKSVSAMGGLPTYEMPEDVDPKEYIKRYKEEFPALKNATDKKVYDHAIRRHAMAASNYGVSRMPAGVSTDAATDKIFGSLKGGELTAGLLGSLAVTIDGEQIEGDEVLEELGYGKDYKTFKKEGLPKIVGFNTGLGKWHATAYKTNGKQVNFFVEPTSTALKEGTHFTQSASKYMFSGKAYEEAFPVDNQNSMFFVNHEDGIDYAVIAPNNSTQQQVLDRLTTIKNERRDKHPELSDEELLINYRVKTLTDAETFNFFNDPFFSKVLTGE